MSDLPKICINDEYKFLFRRISFMKSSIKKIRTLLEGEFTASYFALIF